MAKENISQKFRLKNINEKKKIIEAVSPKHLNTYLFYLLWLQNSSFTYI